VLHPSGLRGTPRDAVLVTHGETDRIAGLLSLREQSAFTLFATARLTVALADDLCPEAPARHRDGLRLSGPDGVLRQRLEAAQAEARLRGVMALDFMSPDYPEACFGGWGSAGRHITPDDTVLCCHATASIPHLTFDSIRDAPPVAIWYDSSAFNASRGPDWMPDPPRSCERREVDFGGCRCQAPALAGAGAAAYPVCAKSPHRHLVEARLADVAAGADRGAPVGYRKIA